MGHLPERLPSRSGKYLGKSELRPFPPVSFRKLFPDNSVLAVSHPYDRKQNDLGTRREMLKPRLRLHPAQHFRAEAERREGQEWIRSIGR